MNSEGAIHVIGAGGHGKVVVSTLQECGYPIAGIYDDSPWVHSQTILGAPVLGAISAVRNTPETRAIVAIGDNRLRKRVVAQLDQVTWVTAIHPTAWVHGSAQIGGGTVVFAKAVVQPSAKIGGHAIINTSASVDHDCALSDYVQLAPGVHLGGTVNIGEGAFLGIGCSVGHGLSIGAWSIVGAGAAVIRDIPDDVVAVGVPAVPR